MITYQVERWSDLINEFKPLFEKHWLEVDNEREAIPLDVDWEGYARIDLANMLCVVTCRDSDSEEKLIGYCITIISYPLHYRTTLHAVVDVYYVSPEYRKSGVGLNLFTFTEGVYKQMGVKNIVTSTKSYLNHSKLFEAMGYTNNEIGFFKLLCQ